MRKRLIPLLEKKAAESESYKRLLSLKEKLVPQRATAVRFRINGEWAKPSFLAEIELSGAYLSVIYDLHSEKVSLDHRRLWIRHIRENEVFLLKSRNVKYVNGNIVEA